MSEVGFMLVALVWLTVGSITGNGYDLILAGFCYLASAIKSLSDEIKNK